MSTNENDENNEDGSATEPIPSPSENTDAAIDAAAPITEAKVTLKAKSKTKAEIAEAKLREKIKNELRVEIEAEIREEAATAKAAVITKDGETVLGEDFKWGWAMMHDSGIIRDNPRCIKVNGKAAYFPYSLDSENPKKVLVQKYFILSAKHCYYEGHIVVQGPKGKPVNKFRPIRPVITFEPLEEKYQSKHGFARYMQENPSARLATKSKNYR